MKTESCEHARNFGKITREDTKSKSYIPQSEMEHAPKNPSLLFPGIFSYFSATFTQFRKTNNWFCTRNESHLSPHKYYTHTKAKDEKKSDLHLRHKPCFIFMPEQDFPPNQMHIFP